MDLIKNGEEQALKNLLTNYKELMKIKEDHNYSVDVVRENTKLRYDLFRKNNELKEKDQLLFEMEEHIIRLTIDYNRLVDKVGRIYARN